MDPAGGQTGEESQAGVSDVTWIDPGAVGFQETK